jgi:hypothetical protein
VQPLSIGTPQHGVGKHLRLDRTTEKLLCLVYFYLVDFSNDNDELNACLLAKTNMGWLWHRRLAHVEMKNLHKLLKGEHVSRLTNVSFEKYKPCAACQVGTCWFKSSF